MDSSSLYGSIKRNIGRAGEDLTLQILTDTGVDLDTGSNTVDTLSVESRGIVGRYRSSELVAGVIDINDLKCTIQSQNPIKKGDKILIGGISHNVINVAKLQRSGVVLKYTLQLRS